MLPNLSVLSFPPPKSRGSSLRRQVIGRLHEIRMKRTSSRDSVWKMPVVASLRVPWVETASFVLCHLEVLAGRRLGFSGLVPQGWLAPGLARGELWIDKQLQGCRGASLSPSLGAAGDACSLQPAATARPLCPHGRLPVQRNRRLGCATQPYLRPFADSPGPGKGVYQPGHLCPGRFRGAESLEGSLAGAGPTHTGLARSPPPGGLWAHRKGRAPDSLRRLRDIHLPPAPSQPSDSVPSMRPPVPTGQSGEPDPRLRAGMCGRVEAGKPISGH